MQLDAIWNCARADLTIKTKQGEIDLFLWEHASRFANAARHISQIPIVSEFKPDLVAVVASALYIEAGWIQMWREGKISKHEIRLSPLTNSNRDYGISMMEKSLVKLMTPDSLQRASLAIRHISQRNTKFIDTQILAEALNLNEFGFIPLWASIRRGMLEGKGVQAVIDNWKRKKEYQFWSARLRDSFRFEPVRLLAAKRLRMFERFMEDLESHHLCTDIEESLLDESFESIQSSTLL